MDAKLQRSLYSRSTISNKNAQSFKKMVKKPYHIFLNFSSSLVLFGSSIHPFVQVISVIFMILSILSCILVGLGYKNGYDNVRKILNIMKS